MRIFFLKITAILLFVLPATSVWAQQIAACNTAQNACSNPGFSLTSNFNTGLPSGLNVSNPQTNPAGNNWSGCLLSNGPGPNWMILTIGNSGFLGFSFGASGSPFPQTGFYDWAMWAYDPNTCTNIFNNTLAPVACCWNAQASGGTGMGPIPPGGGTGNYVPSLPVTVGQQFIILLSNYSGVTTSVSINSSGSAGITCSPLLLPSAIRCPSQQAAITATWAANVTNVTYTIASSMPLSPGTMTIQTSPTFIVAPAATQVYTVFASGSNPLSAVVTSSNTFTVTISSTTTMTVTHPDNVCYGQSATLTANSAGTNYTLVSPPPSATLTSAIPVMTTPNLTAGGTYTMGTTLFSGCTATAAINVSVAPNNHIVVTTPVNTCLNAPSTVLSSSLTSGDGTYIWSGPNFPTQPPPPAPPVSDTAVTTNTLGIPYIRLNQTGVYTVKSKINFLGAFGSASISCPTSSTVQVNVVSTSSVLISASPSNTLCQGTNLHLSANITGTAGFLWNGPHNFNASSQNAVIPSLLPNNTGIYTVTAIFSNGFLSCPKTNTTNISVVATSDPTISIPNNICQGSTAVLSSTASGNPSGYSWSTPTFSCATNNTVIPNIQPSPSDVYYAYAYFTMGVVTCTTRASGQINVVAINTINVIPSPPVCQPNNVQLNASAVGAISYTWTGPGNFVDHQASPVLFHPQTNATGVYTVIVAFSDGVITCYNQDTVSVRINPVLNFSVNPWQQVCYDAPVHITGPTGATSYTWTSSGGFSSNQASVFIPSVSVADAGNYTLTVSLGPCETSGVSTLDVIDRIHQSYYQQSTTICKGDTITLKSEVVGGNGTYYAYTWNPSIYLNSPTGGLQSAVRPMGTTIYNVTVFDTRCPEYKESNTFTVTVLSAAKPDLQLEKNYGCEPLCLTYDSKIDTIHSIVTYDFYKNNEFFRRVQQDPLRNFCLDAGNYTLRIKTSTLDQGSERVCSDSTDYASQITVLSKPGSSISWSPEKPTITDNSVTFFAGTANGTVKSWQWTFGGTYSDTVSAPTVQRLYEYTGKYPVMLTATNEMGCTDTITRYIDILDDFNVFIPNTFTPNGDNLNDSFQMKGTGIKVESFSMVVFDRWGTVLFSTTDPLKGWDGTLKGRAAGEGVYVYKITVNGANGEGKKEYIGEVTLIR